MSTITHASILTPGVTRFEPVRVDPDLVGEMVSKEAVAIAGMYARTTDANVTFVSCPVSGRSPVRISMPTEEIAAHDFYFNADASLKNMISGVLDRELVVSYIRATSTTPTPIAVLREVLEDEARKAKASALIELLDKWIADTSGYDEETWPALKEGIEASRLSDRKRFCA